MSSAYKEPTRDWATAGGIASGIAGPAAGLAEASRVMAENAVIEARNKRNEEAVRRYATNMYINGIVNTDELEEGCAILRKELWLLEEKVVVEEGMHLFDVLFTNAQVTIVDSKHESPSQNTELKVVFRNQYSSEISKKRALVMDGTLQAEISCGDTLVDTVCVPLPMFGVPCGGTADITVKTSKYMVAENGEYTVNFTPNYLCIMER